jgi:DtxR family transcriptional regulator, Mn-dependent transcriptional regulator
MITMLQRKREEILEAIWTAEEKGYRSREQVQKEAQFDLDQAGLQDLRDRGLITLEEDGIHLTLQGKEEAERIVRRHRLAERLLSDVLGMKAEEAEGDACEFEHVPVPEVTESICTLLGHPKECPHGSPIPEGKCCKEARRVVEKEVIPLDDLQAGETGVLAYINTRKHTRLHKLVAFGLCPGAIIKVHQKSPSFVIQHDQTQLALEADVAADIFVRRSPEI